MTAVTEYATTFGLLQWDADLSAIKAHCDPQPPKGEGWTLVTACLGALGPTMGPGKQLLVWTWQREVGLSAESVAKTVGVAVPGGCGRCGGTGMVTAPDDSCCEDYCPGENGKPCPQLVALRWPWERVQHCSPGGTEIARLERNQPKGAAPTPPEPRWTLSTESAEDSWGGNQVRRVLRDGKWAATAPTDVASEIVAAMNAREACPLAHDDVSMASAEKRAAVEALRAAAAEMHDNPELATENWSSWLLERADRIERGEKP